MRKFILGTLLWSAFFVSVTFAKSVILENDDILTPNTISHMQIIGDELEQKTGVFLGVVALKSLNGKSLDDKAKEISSNLKSPYVFILLTTLEKKVEIYMDGILIDKDKILSPSPRNGTIIPLLVSAKSDSDPFNPALMNGYADAAEKIADAKGVKLENAVGNTNKIVLNFIRFFVYGSILLVIVNSLYYKLKRKKYANKE